MTDKNKPADQNFWSKEQLEAPVEVKKHASIESTETTEIQGFFENKKNKTIIAIAGVALALMATVGIGSKVMASNLRQQTTSESTANPNAEKTPRAAELFKEEFGGIYNDPVSTWYSKEAYKTQTGTDLVFSDSQIKSWAKFGELKNSGIPFGFEEYKLNTGTELSEAMAIEIYNNYTCKELSRYANLLAKNPTPEATALIDRQFESFSSKAGNEKFKDLAFTNDDEAIANLMSTVKSIVAKYGSAANYTFQPGSLEDPVDNPSPKGTSFQHGSFTTETDDNDNVIGSNIIANINVSVDIYNKSIVTHANETLDQVYLTILKQPVNSANSIYLSIGQFVPQQ